MPGGGQPVSPDEQAEPVIQAVEQLRHAERFHPRRSQLDRQRHSVQPLHQPGYHRAGLATQGEMRVNQAGPVNEQGHGIRPGGIIARSGQRQRRQPVAGLPGHADRLPARRQDPHVIRGRQQSPDNCATASITCSQLSSTSSSCWRAKTAVSESATATPGRSGMPSSAATADGTRAGS